MTLRIHNLPIVGLVESLHTSLDGLTAEEAQRRLSEFGPNAIDETRGRSLLLQFLRGFTHFFAIILWIGAGIAFFAEWKSPGTGMNLLGCAMLGVIVINGVFSFWQEYKAEQAIAALRKLIPHTVKTFRNGTLTELPSADVVPGDLISLEEGDDVPADCRLIEAFGLRLNNATLTGESCPQGKDAHDCLDEELIHSKNVVLAGTSVFAGRGKALVLATGMRTEFGKIATLTQSARETPSPLQREIVRLSHVIAALAMGVGLVFFFVGRTIGISFWTNIVFALGIIVALVPEGLLPEVTLALATCSQRMAKRNALIRNLPAVETLGCATVICTDKTGTLTQNRMSVKELYLAGESSPDQDLRTTAIVEEARDEPTEQLTSDQEALTQFCMVALNCENTKEAVKDGIKCLVGDSMEIALFDFARRLPAAHLLPRIDEIPFDSDRKRVTTVHRSKDGTSIVYSKGALEQILPCCRYAYTADGVKALTEELRQDFFDAHESMTKRGLRAIAACCRTLGQTYKHDEIENDLTLIGLVGLEDPPREEVKDAIARCKVAGIKVLMITGDHPNTAEAIAKEIGLIEPSVAPYVVTGTMLRKMTETQLDLLLARRELIFARTDADQKMRIVVALQRLGQIVAVTGDGVNDAPALKAADIGIAMGLSGTDVARQAADMILADDNFASIVNAVEEGRAVFANIRKFLTYVLSSNIAELVPYLAFVLFRIPLPLTVMQVLSIDLCADILPALALGSEPPEKEVMQQPPRSRRDGLFDRQLLIRAYLYLGLMVSAASMIVYLWTLGRGGWTYGQVLGLDDHLAKLAQTACLMGIMSMQIVNSCLCRSQTKSLFSLGLFSNKLLNLAIAVYIVLMLIITYAPFAQTIFHTASLPALYWLLLIPFMVTMFAVEELRKLLMRKKPALPKASGNSPGASANQPPMVSAALAKAQAGEKLLLRGSAER